MRNPTRDIVLGLILALGVGVACRWAGMTQPAAATAAVTTLCAVWWVLEPIPIPATSIIPFALFPLLGVLDHREVATAYGHTLILLLMGGFILSTAMARSGAHRRLAYLMIALVGGTSRRRIVLGFMAACALCSMWISNTATVLMMLPVALAVIEQETIERGGIATPLLLGLAYSASVGGLGTPVGTPPNVIFLGVYRETTGQSISFAQWMTVGVPAVLVLIPVIWWWVTRKVAPGASFAIPPLGVWRAPERRVLIVFVLTAIAWVTRTAPFGGWSQWATFSGAGDSTVALLACVMVFVLPNGEGERLLDWKTAARIPWGLLLLFGGGIAIARAFEASGLSDTLGQAMSGMVAWPMVALVLGICLSVTFLTEVTSNTATTTLLMPVLAAAGVAAGIDPAYLMIPAALSASCAFMLPVATAPNAIVFGTERVTVATMTRTGFALNVLGALLLTGVCTLLLPRLLG